MTPSSFENTHCGADGIVRAYGPAPDSTPPTEGWVSRKFIKEAPSTGVGAASADQAKVVSLTHRLETANVQITSVAVEGQKLDAKSLKVETEPVRPGQSYRVTVTYTGTVDGSTVKGKVSLSGLGEGTFTGKK